MSSGAISDPLDPVGPSLLQSVWRYRYVIIVVTLVAGMMGFGLSSLLTPQYETTATIVLSESDAFTDNPIDPERRVEQEANRLTSRAVFSRAADELGTGYSDDDLRSSISVSVDSIVGLLEVTAVSDDPDDAALIANTVTSTYQTVRREATNRQAEAAQEVLQSQGADLSSQIEELEAQVAQTPGDTVLAQRLETLRAQVVALETRITEIAADAALSGAGIGEVEGAVPPFEPSSPQPLRNAALGGIVGLIAAAGFAYWRGVVTDLMKMDSTAILNAPLLAKIPDFKKSSNRTAGDPLFDVEAAEAYQFLVSSFEYALLQHHARTVLVTSAWPGDGKSLTALHLARALAVQGRQVMLVDSDIRARGLTALLRADAHEGLVTLAEGGELDQVVRRYRISPSVQLSVVPAGKTPHQPTGLLGTERYRHALSTIIGKNDLTIIDGSPLLTVADASAVAAQVDAVLLVLDSRTSEDDYIAVRDRLRLVSTPLLGYVLNRVPGITPTQYPYGTQPDKPGGPLKRLFGPSPTSSRPPSESHAGTNGGP